MKRSEMVSKIERYMDENFPMETLYNDVRAKELLRLLEDNGVYPPQVEKKCEEPYLQVYVDKIDIPHWIILGWDDEETE